MTTFVFLPGLISDGLVWQSTADALPAETPTHIADLSAFDSIPAMARSVLEAVPGDMVVIGHSMGGRVAMEIAHQAPDRVKALVLANTGHDALKPGERAKRQEKIDLGNRSMEALVDAWLPPMVAPARQDDPAVMEPLRAMTLAAGPQTHERQITALVARPDAGAYLPDITCPILLLTGREDGWSPVAQHEQIARMAPDAEVHVIEEAGHFMPVERPLETAAEITGWLRRRGFL